MGNLRHQTWEQLISDYGEPVMRFTPKGSKNLSECKRMHQDIAEEVAVFKLPKEYFEEYIVFSCYRKIEWYANSGERLVIRELFDMINKDKECRNENVKYDHSLCLGKNDVNCIGCEFYN